MIRLLALLVVSASLFIGCRPGNTLKPFDITKARDVSLEELERETRHLRYFLFWGRSNSFHYFGTPDGAVYRLPESVFPLAPERGWAPGAAALYVTIQDGHITVPKAGTIR
jgi:hypothetical protein